MHVSCGFSVCVWILLLQKASGRLFSNDPVNLFLMDDTHQQHYNSALATNCLCTVSLCYPINNTSRCTLQRYTLCNQHTGTSVAVPV